MAGWQCPKCSESNGPQRAVCEGCGAQRPAEWERGTWKCAHCGNANPNPESYCLTCGRVPAEAGLAGADSRSLTRPLRETARQGRQNKLGDLRDAAASSLRNLGSRLGGSPRVAPPPGPMTPWISRAPGSPGAVAADSAGQEAKNASPELGGLGAFERAKESRVKLGSSPGPCRHCGAALRTCSYCDGSGREPGSISCTYCGGAGVYCPGCGETQ